MTYEVIWWLIWWPTIWFWNYHERLSYKLLMRLVPKMGSKLNRQSVLCGILIDGNQYPRTGSAEILMVLFLLLPLLLFLLLLIIFKWLPTDWNKHIHISTKISFSLHYMRPYHLQILFLLLVLVLVLVVVLMLGYEKFFVLIIQSQSLAQQNVLMNNWKY